MRKIIYLREKMKLLIFVLFLLIVNINAPAEDTKDLYTFKWAAELKDKACGILSTNDSLVINCKTSLYYFDTQGKEKWRRPLDYSVDKFALSPSGDITVVSSDNQHSNMEYIDKDNNVKWTHFFQDVVVGVAMSSDNHTAVITDDHQLKVFNKEGDLTFEHNFEDTPEMVAIDNLHVIVYLRAQDSESHLRSFHISGVDQWTVNYNIISLKLLSLQDDGGGVYFDDNRSHKNIYRFSEYQGATLWTEADIYTCPDDIKYLTNNHWLVLMKDRDVYEYNDNDGKKYKDYLMPKAWDCSSISPRGDIAIANESTVSYYVEPDGMREGNL